MALCLVRLSVTNLCSIKKNERITPLFGVKTFFRPVLHCALRKFRYLQNKGTFLWNFFLNFGLRKFRHGISIVERAINLAGESSSVSERDKPDSRWSTKLIIPPSSDARPLYSLSQRSPSSVYGTILSRGSICDSRYLLPLLRRAGVRERRGG